MYFQEFCPDFKNTFFQNSSKLLPHHESNFSDLVSCSTLQHYWLLNEIMDHHQHQHYDRNHYHYHCYNFLISHTRHFISQYLIQDICFIQFINYDSYQRFTIYTSSMTTIYDDCAGRSICCFLFVLL